MTPHLRAKGKGIGEAPDYTPRTSTPSRQRPHPSPLPAGEEATERGIGGGPLHSASSSWTRGPDSGHDQNDPPAAGDPRAEGANRGDGPDDRTAPAGDPG